MPANQFGIDLGEAVTSGQNMLRNQLLIQKAKKEADTENKLVGVRQRAAAGDKTAMQDMLVLSPEETQRFSAAIGQMDENQRKQTEQNLHMIGAAAATVLHSGDPEKTFQYIKTQFPAEVTANWPQNYDQNWTTYHLAQAKDGMSLLKSTAGPPTKVTIGTQDRLYSKDGKLIESAKSGEQVRHEQRGVGGGSGVPSRPRDNAAFSAQAYNMAKDLVGGINSVNDDGEKIIDKGKADQASWIQTRALYNMNKNGGSLAQNIRQAHQEMLSTLDRERGSSVGRSTGVKRPSAKGIF